MKNLGTFTTSHFENGLHRVNNKISLYRSSNKPSFDLEIVFDKKRLVISFDEIENSKHIKKQELEIMSIEYWTDRYGFQEKVLVVKQKDKNKNAVIHLFFYYNESIFADFKTSFNDYFDKPFMIDELVFFEKEMQSVDKTIEIFIKQKNIKEDKLDLFLHQIRRLINYFSAENELINLNQRINSKTKEVDLSSSKLHACISRYF